VNALQPAAVSKVVLDEDKKHMDVVVPEDQLSLAIGRRGQNVRLASILTGWDIDIMTDEQESERRTEEFSTRSALFIESLDVDDTIAQLLVVEGFSSVEEIAETPLEELNEIEGFEDEISNELQQRAINWLNQKTAELKEKQSEFGIADDLMTVEGLRADQIMKIGQQGIKTLDDLADLAGDELVELLGENQMSEKEANAVIMKAREHWFAEEDAAAAKAVEEAEANAKAEATEGKTPPQSDA
ncbi:MAG: transcription termination/antitermination protein NusA, partial [Gammaproteobacteria bacterium]|nr:transcription termination/antitermination protein NusA [Gammaproteobacteria bacterium]